MKRCLRILVGGWMAAVLFVVGGASVWAAEDREAIDSISLDVSSTIVSGSSSGNVYISKADDGNYRVGSVEILNSNDDWMGGMTPRVQVSLYAYNGYYFSSSSKNIFFFSGEDVTIESVSRLDDKTELSLKLKLSKLDNGDLTVTGPYWDENHGIAYWDENTSARYYQVRLYRDDSLITASKQTSENEYDFASNITKRGDYYFEVRAVGSSSEKGDWVSSDTWYVSAYEADDLSYSYSDGPGGYTYSSGGPGVIGEGDSYSSYVSAGPGATGDAGTSGSAGVATADGNHWCLDTNGWWYQYADGNRPSSCFQQIDGVWYYFNSAGYITTGWFELDGKWYYCDSSGAMYVNARTPDGYYVGGDGAWIQ